MTSPLSEPAMSTEEHTATKPTESRVELKAQLKAAMKAQAAEDLEDGELPEPRYIYKGQSDEWNSITQTAPQAAGSSKSEVSVYKDPPSPLSRKRKANDEGSAPEAKKAHNSLSNVAHTAGGGEQPQKELDDIDRMLLGELDPFEQTSSEVGQLKAPKVTNLLRPVTGSQKGPNVARPMKKVVDGGLVSESKPALSEKARTHPQEAYKTTMKRHVDTIRDVDADVEDQRTSKRSAPNTTASIGPRTTAAPKSAFDRIGERNAGINKRERERSEQKERIRVKIEKIQSKKDTATGLAPFKSRVEKSRNTKEPKTTKLAEKLRQTHDSEGNLLAGMFSISTADPPRTASRKPTVAQTHKTPNEETISGRVGSIQKKRKAEEDLEDAKAKIAKDRGLPKHRSISLNTAATSAQTPVTYGAVPGKGSKGKANVVSLTVSNESPNSNAGQRDIKKMRVPRSAQPERKPQPMVRGGSVRNAQHSDEGSRGQRSTHKDLKRKSEDQADSDHPLKKARITEPKGLKNFSRACFANAPLQCLLEVPELRDHYETLASGVISDVEKVVNSCPDLDKKRRTVGRVNNQRKAVRSILKQHEKDISLGAYFGEVLHEAATGEGQLISPFKFLQAFGTLFEDDGNPLNGETSQEAKQFVDELLQRLDVEEQEQATLAGNEGQPTLIQKLFGIKTSKHLYCTVCQLCRAEDPVVDTSVNVVLPRKDETTSLAKLLESTGQGQLLSDYKCPNPQCKQRGRTVERYQLEGTSKYLIVQAPRVGEKLDTNGRSMMDNDGDKVSTKIHEKVQFPEGAINLSALLPEDQQAEGPKYEIFGMILHRGGSHYDGHYIALKKVGGQWWECDDEETTPITNDDLSDYNNGQLFFLRRVD